MILRWPVFAIELLLCAVALGLAVASLARRCRGFEQVPIIMPWLAATGLFAGYLLYESSMTFGFVLLYDLNVVALYSLLVAGPASVACLLAVRLWKHG